MKRVGRPQQLSAARSMSRCGDTTEKALSPIRRRVRGTTRSPDDEERSADRAGTSATDVSNNNNNNSHDNVYGAVIMTEVIARVHPVHLMNVD